jgi:Domain of unknown function (DUF4124)/Penicillin-Binding Protein C-terminus Family
MKTSFPLLASCLLAFVVQAQETKLQMWKWTDANGVVHYSDIPAPGAVQVGVDYSQGQPDAAPAVQGPGASRSSPAPTQQAVSYTSLAIVQPQNEASYFEANSVVDVQIDSSPSLADGDSIYLYLDGKRIGNTGDSLSYSLPNVERGAHTLTAVIFDSQGNQKIRSQPVTFYMKQPTINSPAAVGPSVPPNRPDPGRPRPPPRPTPNPGG